MLIQVRERRDTSSEGNPVIVEYFGLSYRADLVLAFFIDSSLFTRLSCMCLLSAQAALSFCILIVASTVSPSVRSVGLRCLNVWSGVMPISSSSLRSAWLLGYMLAHQHTA